MIRLEKDLGAEAIQHGRKVGFTFRDAEGRLYKVEPEQLSRFAESIGLAAAAPGRFSGLLAFQLLAYSEVYGLDPGCVIREVCRLEGQGDEGTLTKPATPFKHDGPLRGLWHKHFTSDLVSMVAGNILAGRPKSVLRLLVVEELSAGVTVDALERLVKRVVMDGYEKRADAGILTGEWLVYMPVNGENLYLCVATHRGGDEEVLGYLRSACVAEFPVLRKALPNAFSSAS